MTFEDWYKANVAARWQILEDAARDSERFWREMAKVLPPPSDAPFIDDEFFRT